MKNNKGFTLIELLAVIVILGVLMIIAIPMVSRYIKEARQNAFIDTAKSYVQSARYAYLNGDYYQAEATNGNCAVLDAGAGTVYIRFKYIDVDKTGGNSSFGKPIDTENSYVKITSDANGKYSYFVFMRDDASNGFQEKAEDALVKGDVKSGIDASKSSISAAAACKK